MKIETMIQNEKAKLDYITCNIENHREFITSKIKQSDIDAVAIRNSAIQIEKLQSEAREINQTIKMLESLKEEQ